MSGGSLGTLKGRPNSVGGWFKRKYVAVIDRPTNKGKQHIEKDYGPSLTEWWSNLQPESRRIQDGRELKRISQYKQATAEHDWSSLQVCGRSGMLSYVRSLFIWGLNIETTGSTRLNWLDVVYDVERVLQVLNSLLVSKVQKKRKNEDSSHASSSKKRRV
jgi:hypothetical protein